MNKSNCIYVWNIKISKKKGYLILRRIKEEIEGKNINYETKLQKSSPELRAPENDVHRKKMII